jgi:hypothetical protein
VGPIIGYLYRSLTFVVSLVHFSCPLQDCAEIIGDQEVLKKKGEQDIPAPLLAY